MEESKVPTPRELLKEQADLLGVEYKSNISDAKLKELVEDAMKPTKKETKEVEKPKSKAELTDEEIVQERIAELRLEMTKLKRCIISCNDPQMKEYESTPYLSISNSVITMPKIVVPFNVEWHVPQAYYDMLRNQTCYIDVKGKDAKGRTITTRKEIKKYNIQDLPDLTTEEIQDLKTMQIMRDGVKSE